MRAHWTRCVSMCDCVMTKPFILHFTFYMVSIVWCEDKTLLQRSRVSARELPLLTCLCSSAAVWDWRTTRHLVLRVSQHVTTLSLPLSLISYCCSLQRFFHFYIPLKLCRLSPRQCEPGQRREQEPAEVRSVAACCPQCHCWIQCDCVLIF